MVKLKKNILKFLILVFFIVVLMNTCVYATDSIMQGAESFLNKGSDDVLDLTQIKKTSDIIYNVFVAVGSAIVVIVGAVLGIQFIFGSAEEKAKVQETFIPYIVGTVIIYGSFAIWELLVTVMAGIK